MLFGDSITQKGMGVYNPANIGWVDLLNGYYTRRVDVFNRGLSGYTSQWALDIALPPLEALLNQQPVDLCTLWFGANDACREGLTQHVPVDQYVVNMRTLIRKLKAKSKHVLVISPPPICKPKYLEWRSAMVLQDKHGRAYTDAEDRSTSLVLPYHSALTELCLQEDVVMVDVYTAMLQREAGFDALLDDGLHLSGEGNRFVYELVLKEVEKVYPVEPNALGMKVSKGSKCAAFPVDVPFWDEIN